MRDNQSITHQSNVRSCFPATHNAVRPWSWLNTKRPEQDNLPPISPFVLCIPSFSIQIDHKTTPSTIFKVHFHVQSTQDDVGPGEPLISLVVAFYEVEPELEPPTALHELSCIAMPHML